MTKLRRVVAWYRRSNDELVNERLLGDVSAADLRGLFNIDDDPEAVLIYKIGPGQRRYFGEKVGEPFDFRRFDYFVETTAPPMERKPSTNGSSRQGTSSATSRH